LIEGTTPDIVLHSLTVATALALFGVSYQAYMKKESEKFLYVCAAFAVFAFKEAIVTAEIMGVGNGVLVGTSHVLNLVILLLFFRGTVK
jgi:hypothetical protein